MIEPVARNPERSLTMSRNDLINRLVARKLTPSRPARKLCWAGTARKLCYAGTQQPASKN
jgi:hypothetical protein